MLLWALLLLLETVEGLIDVFSCSAVSDCQHQSCLHYNCVSSTLYHAQPTADSPYLITQ